MSAAVPDDTGRCPWPKDDALYIAYLALVALHDAMESTLSAISTYILCPFAGLIALLLIIGALRQRPHGSSSPPVEERQIHLR